MALANAGCAVEALCPPQHPLCKTNAVRRNYEYRSFAPLKSLRTAIAAANPYLIVPGDDLTTFHLHQLYLQARGRGQEASSTRTLIERSFGPPENFSVVYKRAAFIELAEEVGVRVPKTMAIAEVEDLRRWASQTGFPIVLKADGTSGGHGVRIVHTIEEAQRAFRMLQAPPLLARAVKRALVDRDNTLVWPSLLRQRSALSAQAFVAGHEATSTVACWNGTVLAGLHFEIINKIHSSGPATVMRLVDNQEMSGAVEKMVSRLKLSGLHGFDFMLESQTGKAYMIEINPRATQVSHLTLGPGLDLPAALYAAMSGSSMQPAPKLTEKETIALFPQEWMRDPASPFLSSAYHDVPWAEPELIAACFQYARKQSRSRAMLRWILPSSVMDVPHSSSAPVRSIRQELSECKHD